MLIDNKTIEQARNVDLIDFLEKRDWTFAKTYDGYRCCEHPSLAVKNDRCSWYWHSRSVGGNGAISFLMMVDKMPFPKAVNAIISGSYAALPPPESVEAERQGRFKLPGCWKNTNTIEHYLCRERHISSSIVYELIRRGMIYEDYRHNVVFLGKDDKGFARFASVRGTCSYRMFRRDCAGSDKRYGFYMPSDRQSERLYVFESAIDAMSHASLVNYIMDDALFWKEDSRISLAGTSDVALTLLPNRFPHVNELVFCLDNDPAGREATDTLMRKYDGFGYRTRCVFPSAKDYNDMLKDYMNRDKSKPYSMNL